MKDRASELHGRAVNVLPGGFSNLNCLPGGKIYVAHAQGAYVTDVNGVKRTDFANHWTCLIHGHGHPDVLESGLRQFRKGTLYGFSCEAEVELAELMVARVKSVDLIKFCTSGSSAVSLAMRAAYSFTGRSKIAKLEGAYHGYSDAMLISVAPPPDVWGSPSEPSSVPVYKGMPTAVPGNTIVLPLNDLEASERLLRKHGPELAAVFIDLLPVGDGPTLCSPAYVSMLRRVTREIGALLVFDEVVSFRLAPGGLQASYADEPDLTTFGKIIGGGFPVGAVGGRREVMAVFDQTGESGAAVPIYGTFTANPMTMVVGLASMRALREPEFDQLTRLGDRVRSGLNAAFARTGVEGQARGYGSLFVVHLKGGEMHDYRSAAHNPQQWKRKLAVHRYMFDHGFMFNQPFIGCTSTAMTVDDVDAMVATFETGLRELAAQGVL